MRINVAALRKKLDWTQEQMGAHLGVDQSTIHRWELRKRKPRGPARKMLEQLAASVKP